MTAESCACLKDDERVTRSLREVAIVIIRASGNSLVYPIVYFSTCFGSAPVQEKRRMTEGDEERRDEAEEYGEEDEQIGYAWSYVGFRCQMPSDKKSKPARKFGGLSIGSSGP